MSTEGRPPAAKKTWLETLDRPAFVLLPAPGGRPPERMRLGAERARLTQKIALIQTAVAAFYAVRHADMIGPSRGQQPISWARQVAMVMIRELTGATLEECGMAFNRDSEAVRYNRRAVRDMAESYPEIAAELSQLRDRLQSQIADLK